MVSQESQSEFFANSTPHFPGFNEMLISEGCPEDVVYDTSTYPEPLQAQGQESFLHLRQAGDSLGLGLELPEL